VTTIVAAPAFGIFNSQSVRSTPAAARRRRSSCAPVWQQISFNPQPGTFPDSLMGWSRIRQTL
jgi:hypothetical protein